MTEKARLIRIRGSRRVHVLIEKSYGFAFVRRFYEGGYCGHRAYWGNIIRVSPDQILGDWPENSPMVVNARASIERGELPCVV